MIPDIVCMIPGIVCMMPGIVCMIHGIVCMIPVIACQCSLGLHANEFHSVRRKSTTEEGAELFPR